MCSSTHSCYMSLVYEHHPKGTTNHSRQHWMHNLSWMHSFSMFIAFNGNILNLSASTGPDSAVRFNKVNSLFKKGHLYLTNTITLGNKEGHGQIYELFFNIILLSGLEDTNLLIYQLICGKHLHITIMWNKEMHETEESIKITIFRKMCQFGYLEVFLLRYKYEKTFLRK